MSEGTSFDKTTYDAAKPYLKEALEHIVAAGRSMKDLAEFATEKFGNSFYPYLREFQQEIRSGKIKVQGLQASAKASMFGEHISPEDRDRMIRDAAYLRAERRGFVGGNPDEDWAAAEAEIDELLARNAGLFERGKTAMQSARTTAEKELGSIREVVSSWIEGRGEESKTAKPAETSAKPAAGAAQEPATEQSKSTVAAKPEAAPAKKSTAAPRAKSAPKAKQAAPRAGKPAGSSSTSPAPKGASGSITEKSAGTGTKAPAKKTAGSGQTKAAPGDKASAKSTQAAPRTRRPAPRARG